MTVLEQAFEQSLFELIPQTRNLGIKIAHVGEYALHMQGSHALNKNHLQIVFGGSIAATAITTAWSLLQHKTQSAGLVGNLVIKQQSVQFLRPVHADFECIARLTESDWLDFIRQYQTRRRARIEVTAELLCEGKACAQFEGTFVLFEPKSV